MPDDYRIPVGYFGHPKTKKLRRKCGPDGIISHLRLIEFCTVTESRTNGSLAGLDDDDIEIAACWDGSEGHFINALADVGFIDGESGSYCMHDWEVWQPWVSGAEERSKAAKRAAAARWEKKGVRTAMRNDADRNAPRIDPQCPNTNSKPNSKPNSRSKTNTNKTLSLSKTESDGILLVFDHYRTYHPRAHRKPHSKQKEWVKIKARLAEGYTVEDLKLAIDGCHKSAFHCGDNENGKRYNSLELIVRDGSKVQQFMEIDGSAPKQQFYKKRKKTWLDGTRELMEAIDNAENGNQTIHSIDGGIAGLLRSKGE
jgi:hypothetical protein